MNNHTNQTCRKKDKANAANANEVIDHSFDFGFSCREVVAVNDDPSEDEEHAFNLQVYKDVIEETEEKKSREVDPIEAEDQKITEVEIVETETEEIAVQEEKVSVISANMNIEKGEVLATNSDPAAATANNGLLVDSGSTSHIVNTDEGFVDEDKDFKPQNHMIELADGTITKSDAQKKGTVKMNLRDESGEVRTTYLHDALYCPNYPHNLFSVRAATAKGAELHFTTDHDELLWNDVKYPIQREGKLYFVFRHI